MSGEAPSRGKRSILQSGAQGARRLWRSLTEPRAFDEDRRRREFILNVILVGSLAMLAALDGLVLYHSVVFGSRYRGIPFVEFSGILLFFAALYALSRKGSAVPASYLLVAAYFCGAGYAAYEWGADLETALLGFALIIVMAGVLLGSRVSFATASATGVFLISLWYLQWEKIIPIPKQQVQTGSDAIAFTALYFIIALVAWLSNREIERSLFRARRSESALQEERDLLEIRVEERTRELRQTEFQKMEQLYRFAEFGQLSSGLFHDLLNIINASMLQNERMARGAEDALANARKANKRVEDFVEAVRRQLAREEVREEFSVGDVIGQAVNLLSYKAKTEHVRIAPSCASAVTLIGNPFRLHQVVMNLVLNGIEAYASGDAAGRERIVAIEAEADGDKGVILRVRDNGCGMTAEVASKLFQPFFTTKSSSGGLGIGLATVKKIIEDDFGGSILVQSEVGKGTVFTIELRNQ